MAQNQIFKGTARKVVKEHSVTSFYYHNTVVVIKDAFNITLNSGGYRTATTKAAMNQAANEHGLGFNVYQDKGQWYVSMHGNTVPFVDGMKLPRTT